MNWRKLIPVIGLCLILFSGNSLGKNPRKNPEQGPITREEAEAVLKRSRQLDVVLQENVVLEARVVSRERQIQALRDTLSDRDRMITHLREDNATLRQQLSDTGNELQAERGMKRAYMWGLITIFALAIGGILAKVFGWIKIF